MGLTLSWEVLRLQLREPFVIARSEHGAGRAITTLILELRDERYPDIVGLGEGYPDPYYGETPETMAVLLPILAAAVGEVEMSPAGLVAAATAMNSRIARHGAAKCAIDIALHDLAGKVRGLPVHRLLDLPTSIPPTDFTIGIDEPAVVAERARRARIPVFDRARDEDRRRGGIRSLVAVVATLRARRYQHRNEEQPDHRPEPYLTS